LQGQLTYALLGGQEFGNGGISQHFAGAEPSGDGHSVLHRAAVTERVCSRQAHVAQHVKRTQFGQAHAHRGFPQDPVGKSVADAFLDFEQCQVLDLDGVDQGNGDNARAIDEHVA